MKTVWGNILHGLLGLPLEETSYQRRGFRGATERMRARLEQVGATFLDGYHAAIGLRGHTTLPERLDLVDLELRGFAYEGAAMGLALLDTLTPWRPYRLASFLNGPGEPHAYMVHVGAGWVWARFPFGFRRAQRRLDPLLSWLAFDGWGFHEGFFRWQKYLPAGPPPRRLAGYERQVFDQGLGRSLWFVNGGDPSLVASTIAGFPAARQPHLWSGIGLAATYAGILDEAGLKTLRAAAGDAWPQLAQGAAFAAKARRRAGNATEYTELATTLLCNCSVTDAARLCDDTLDHLPADAPLPGYEIWRQRIQHHFSTPRQSATARRLQAACA